MVLFPGMLIPRVPIPRRPIPRMLRSAAGLVLLALLAGCGQPVGTACTIEGSGFTARHPCASKCLSRWNVRCPNGDVVQPQICAGKSDCQPGSCPTGQVCYHFEDPFDDVSYCLPKTVCGRPLNQQEARNWERHSEERASQLRQRRQQSPLGTKSTAPVTKPASASQ